MKQVPDYFKFNLFSVYVQKANQPKRTFEETESFDQGRQTFKIFENRKKR